MVLASFVTRLVPRVGPRLRLTSAPLTTCHAAVDLASIASPTNIEDRFTSGACRLPKTLHPALPSEGRDEVGIACPLCDTPGDTTLHPRRARALIPGPPFLFRLPLLAPSPTASRCLTTSSRLPWPALLGS